MKTQVRKKVKKQKTKSKPLTFKDHLEELRVRLFWSSFVFVFGTILGFVINKQLISILLHPLHQTVYYTSPTGAVDFVIQVCLFFGFLVALPVIAYNILRFVEPAFTKKVSHNINTILLASFLLMLLGICFAYFVNLPTALHFFSTFSTSQVHALISTDAYVSFVLADVLGFALIFQLPLVLLFINSLQPIKITWLIKQEKFVIVISFLLGALLTPDPINQIIMALPIILLYQLSLLFIYLQNHRVRLVSI